MNDFVKEVEQKNKKKKKTRNTSEKTEINT